MVDEDLIRLRVPLFVAGDLRAPKLRVPRRGTVVLRAAMPKAPVDENGNTCGSKDEIGCPAHARQWAAGDPIPEATCVEESPYFPLRLGVATAVPLHRRSHLWRRCPGFDR
jgi:hypothetical protein